MNVTTLPNSIDTLIVGAGHTGLVMSALLRDAGVEHLVVERREQLGGGWQDRWDEFTLVTPNWTASFPGYPYDGLDPHGFMPRDAIVQRVRRYADVIDAPVALATAVGRLSADARGGFLVRTRRGDINARRVVVATGSYHTPRVPSFAGRISSRVHQVHSHHYRNVGELPPGAVLVVGSGQSGVQLAEELHSAGRKVYLSVGTAGRAPRRYRGRDFFEWLRDLGMHGSRFGLGLPTVDTLPPPPFPANPHLSGHNGGHDTNLRQFAVDGMTLTGRMVGADGEHATFAADLSENLARADRFFDERFGGRIDRYIEAAGLDAPPDDRVTVDHEPPEVTALDLHDAGISTVLWTAGYQPDFGWIDAPILEPSGYPRHVRGVSEIQGLFFLGLHYQWTQGSATLFGPPMDGRHLLQQMGAASAPA